MVTVADGNSGLLPHDDEAFALDCPHCGTYAHMTRQSVPRVADLLRNRPRYVGIVYQCDACNEPVFLRYAVRGYRENSVDLSRDFTELERPKERFAFSYLPKETEVLFREALSCYSSNNLNAFASMCRRAAVSAFRALGEDGRLQAFEEIVVAQDIAGIDDETFAPIKAVLFDASGEEELPLLKRAQAGLLLEIMKDMFYQCFVRRGKLTRAIKVRRFFVQDNNGDVASSA